MQLSQYYCNNIRGMFQVPKSDRLKAMLGAIERKEAVTLHNRYFYDTFQLLNQTSWKKQIEWNFFQINDLLSEKINDENLEPALINEFKDKLKKASDETFTSFKDFQTANQSQSFNETQAYLDWFYYNFPYIELELVDKKETRWKEAFLRLDWFLERCKSNLDLNIQYNLKNYALNHLFLPPGIH